MLLPMQQAIQNALQLKDLSPSTRVNRVMSQLVESIIMTPELDVATFAATTVTQVQRVSAQAEAALEVFWANAITASDNPRATLESFPYLQNYKELTRRELVLVAASHPTPRILKNALIIGSGPLPLSAYEIYCHGINAIDHVDSSQKAIELCQKVSQVFGLTSEYYHANGEDVVLSRSYDLILIAALAGDTAHDKQRIIDNVLPSLTLGGRLIVRSARGNRELLYPAVKASQLKHMQLLKEYHPTDSIINSVFVYKKPV